MIFPDLQRESDAIKLFLHILFVILLEILYRRLFNIEEWKLSEPLHTGQFISWINQLKIRSNEFHSKTVLQTVRLKVYLVCESGSD